jgi:hypothetical protein
LPLAKRDTQHLTNHDLRTLYPRCPAQAAVGHLMRLEWILHAGGAWSAVGDHGTWIIVNVSTVDDPAWWLGVQPLTSHDMREHGTFPTKEAAQEHAQDREDGVRR